MSYDLSRARASVTGQTTIAEVVDLVEALDDAVALPAMDPVVGEVIGS